MRYLYKILAVMVACSIAFAIPVMQTSVTATEPTEYLYYEDFESMTVGDVPTGVYSGKNAYASKDEHKATSELAEVQYDKDKKSNYMLIPDNQSAFQHAEIFFDEPVSSGTVVLEYDVYIDNPGSGMQYSSHKIVNANFTSNETRNDSTTLGVMNYKGHGGGGSPKSTALYSAANTFKYAQSVSDPDNTDGVSYAVNKWQHCRLEIDLDNYSETLWVEGVRSLEQPNAALNNNKMLDGFVFSTDFAPGRGAWRFDNIKAYKAVPSIRTMTFNSYTGNTKAYEITTEKYDISDLITTMVSQVEVEFTSALSDASASLINTSTGEEESVALTMTDTKNCLIELDKKYLEPNVQYTLKLNGTTVSGELFVTNEVNFSSDSDGGFVMLDTVFEKNDDKIDWQSLAKGDTVDASISYVLTDTTQKVDNAAIALVGEKGGKICAFNQVCANMDQIGKSTITVSTVLEEVPDKLTVFIWNADTRIPVVDSTEINAVTKAEDLSNAKYELTGDKNTKATITVLPSDINLDDLMAGGSTVRPICYREVTADENGKYSTSFYIGEDSDTYNVYIGLVGRDVPFYDTLKYINQEKNKTAIDSLNAQGAVTSEIFRNYAKDLGVRKSLADLMDESDYDAAANMYDKEKAAQDSSAEVMINAEKVFAISIWNSGKIDVFGDDIDAFSVPESVSKWFDKKYMSDNEKKEIQSKVSKKAVKFEDFDKSIAEETALRIIYAADGYGDIQTYLSENAELLGINKNKITSALCRDIIGKKFDSIESIDIDNRIPDKTQYGGGSSKGSGGGGGTVKNIYAEIDKTQPEPIEKKDDVEFSDLSGYEWAKDAILNLYDKKIINGRAEGIFAPSENVLREEFAKMISGAADFETLSGNISFDDVKVDDWFYEPVKQMFLAHIIKGESETIFGSGKNIIRQDMAVMCFNVLSEKGLVTQSQSDDIKYSDYADIDDYAREAVSVLSEYGIISGSDDNNFYPLANATRAEAAQLINNVLSFINQ